MSDNDQCPSEKLGDSSKLMNWILDSGATCHMISEVSEFILGLLEATDEYIEVTDGHNITEKQREKIQIKMCDDSGNKFISTLHNVLLAPDLCNRLFSIFTLINSGHTCLFHKGFFTVYFGAK